MKLPSKSLVPAGHIQIRDNVLIKDNVAGILANKGSWAKGLNLPRKGEYTFLAGCGYQFMKYAETILGTVRNMEKMGLSIHSMMALTNAFGKVGVDLPTITAKVASSWMPDIYCNILVHAVNVLHKIGLSLGYLYEDEPCCSSPLYYAGFLDECVVRAKSNYQVFLSYEVRKIVGMVPACISMIRDFYPKHIEHFEMEVDHFFEVVARKLKEQDIRPRLKERMVVTYHDPCQLSRYLHIIEEPREIMMRIEGLELIEPKEDQCKEWSTCCGGGGLEVSNHALSKRLGERRIMELLETGAKTIVTGCPACMLQLRSAAKSVRADVRVIDLAEIIDRALE